MFAELWEDGNTLTQRVELPKGCNPDVIIHNGIGPYATYVRKNKESCEFRRGDVYFVPPPVVEET